MSQAPGQNIVTLEEFQVGGNFAVSGTGAPPARHFSLVKSGDPLVKSVNPFQVRKDTETLGSFKTQAEAHHYMESMRNYYRTLPYTLTEVAHAPPPVQLGTAAAHRQAAGQHRG